MTALPPVLEIAEGESDGRVVLRLRGELDIGTGEELQARLVALRGARRPVFLDVGGLTFVDSQGVQLLLSNARAAEGSGGLTISRGPQLMRVAELLGLDAVLPFEPS